MMPRATGRYTGRMFEPRRIQHCRVCGSRVEYRTPADDNRDRAVCTVCSEIHYENPINVVGTVPMWEDKVLLCLRNIEPRRGFWTLPAGFLELGETTADGGAHIELQSLFTVLNVVRAGQLHLYYLAQLQNTRFAPGPETIEARLFTEAEIPWDEIAFRTVRDTLRHYFDDRRRGAFGIHIGDIG
jgi:ADP-ribose pyrophosphatase YjhB (NUDIX family)